MAKTKKGQDAALDNISSKSSILTYGTDNTLNTEDAATSNIISQTIISTKEKFGIRTSGKPINYFNELNIGNAFEEMKSNVSDKREAKKNKDIGKNFKELRTDNSQIDASSLLLSEQGRLINFSNYNIIYEHIPECAQALDIFKDNIMSPDDFTKMIFNVKYDSDINKNDKDVIENQLKDIITKYRIEEKADKIIGETLKMGEYYVAVLSLDDELNIRLNNGNYQSRNTGRLNEQALALDKDATSILVNSNAINLNESEVDAFKTILNEDASEKTIANFIAETINNNVKIGSKAELLLERVQANNDFSAGKGYNLSDIPGASLSKDIDSPKRGRKKDNKPLCINGSTIRLLDPSRVVELRVDNVCYGYYYVEDLNLNSVTNMSYLGPSSGREAKMGTGVNMGLNSMTPGASKYTPATSAASTFNVSEQKLKLITDVFVSQFATKVDKNFIRRNKKFKEFIYELIRQDYIIKKGVKFTYFGPNEVIKFELPAIYSKIVFASKLYLSVMTNDILVKLGRAHDKRVFYVNTGLDADYEQAINKTIDDIKRREYKMDNVNDFNSILNLNPGRWDDYFIPTINGDRPLEIDTLAGMDTDLNSDFLQYLKNTMLSGIGVPTNLIDSVNDISFARTLSAQNSNFVRNVIRDQKLLTPCFSRMLQILYKNEYKYSDNGETNLESNIDISAIKIHFPSPAALNMSNITEQIQVTDQNADFIASQIIQPKADGSTEDTRIKLKSAIVKDLMPGIDWDKYEKLKDRLELESKKEAVKNSPQQPEPGQDPYAGQMTGY